MKYALGYALNLKDLFRTFNVKRLKMSTKTCEELVGNRHKELVIFKIMKYCIKLVIEDVIHNNATFHLPTSKRKACIKMSKVSDDDFVKARRNGKWRDVDFLMSDFSGYQMIFLYSTDGMVHKKPIYLDSRHKHQITKYTNEGKQYF